MLGSLLSKGYEIVNDTAHADVLLINTCAFIESARSEAYGTIEEYAERKKKKQRLVIAGCLPVYDKEALLERFPQIDLVIGPAEIYRLPELLESAGRSIQVGKLTYELPAASRLVTTGSASAYLKIAEGCDHGCAFCTIPRLRGPFRSKSREAVLAEAQSLAAGGIKELILVAQDTTRYGLDLDGTLQLPGLLRELAKLEGVQWMRIMYGHPAHVTDELIEVMATEAKVCKYLDLPLQHIDNEVLQSMDRGITEDEVRSVIRKIKERIPDIALRTTFIVGYPGETEAQFNKLLEYIKEVRFTQLGVFVYSPESGTAAARLAGVDGAVARKRYEESMEVQQKIALENNKMLVGKDMTVLMETAAYGRTYRDAPEIDCLVHVDGDHRPGSFVNARITGASAYDLSGKVMR